MKKRVWIAFCLMLLILLQGNLSLAQPRRYSVSNAHSHNDYLNKEPFYNAFRDGFASIEVDIFVVENELLVAHSKKEIDKSKTLKALYLGPLNQELAGNPERKITLLVDIKGKYDETLPILIRQLEPLKSIIASKSLTILITGNRPPPSAYKNYPEFLQFDDDLKLSHLPLEWARVGQVSLPFTRFSNWKGIGKPEKSELKKLKHTVDSVHFAGKPIRFWAAPDTKASWKLQKNLGVDLIGTDQVEKLAEFLK